MTEREYVEALRDGARAYLEFAAHWSEGKPLDPNVHGPTIGRWEAQKAKLSPATMVRLAETWLAKGEDVP